MDQLPPAFMVVLATGSLAGTLLLPGIVAFAAREMFRRSPAATAAFIGPGSWIALSKRFGVRYAVAGLVAPFTWILVGPRFLPDTDLGAWLLFGPALLSIALGVSLGALAVARWMVASPHDKGS